MRNYVWGGKETHRVGTPSSSDFCRRVGAEPLYCVNFKADGFSRTPARREGDRTGDAKEAADWVSYCNDPDHAERKARPRRAVQHQALAARQRDQLRPRRVQRDEAIAHTIEFAQAMRERDPTIQLIAWGDNGWAARLWATDMLRQAGEHSTTSRST